MVETGGEAGTRTGGPYFDDLSRGQRFDQAPSVTLTDGAAAAHRSIVGGRLRLALDHRLSAAVVPDRGPLASPALVWDTAIGQSTLATQRVLANLFYRGLAFHRFPAIGDTLHTTTEVAALKQNRSGPTGLAALRVRTVDHHGRTVLDFWRCAMLPRRDPSIDSGYHDDLDQVGAATDGVGGAGGAGGAAGVGGGSGAGAAGPSGAIAGWALAAFRQQLPGRHFDALSLGDRWEGLGGDVVSSAPELARLTGNLAAVHHDRRAARDGRRLVYGGHTIGLAFTQALTALPNLVTVVAWHGCDHTGPVHEGDTLSSTLTVERLEPFSGRGGGESGGGLVHLRSVVTAAPSSDTAPDGTADGTAVLDWRFVAVLA